MGTTDLTDLFRRTDRGFVYRAADRIFGFDRQLPTQAIVTGVTLSLY